MTVNDFDFDIVNFPFLDGDVHRTTFYGVYISQPIRLARMSNHLADFNAGNKGLTTTILQQGIVIINKGIFFRFYRRHFELVSNDCWNLYFKVTYQNF